MISPVPLHTLLHRTDVNRVHYTPEQASPRHLSDGLVLMARALAYVPVSVVRTERGVPTRVLRTLHPDELGRHQLLPGVTAYAWAFTHQEDGQPPQTVLIVVAAAEIRSPRPEEHHELWGRYALDRPRTECPDRPGQALQATTEQAARPPRRKAKPAKPRPDGRAGKKGPKNKGRKRR